jgi:phosphoglucomutase
MLMEVYMQYGFYYETLVSLTKKGMTGAEEIKQMMADLRSNPPKTINGSPLVSLKDYENRVETHIPTGKITPMDFEKSNVLQFITEDGSKISARPSGTEPKIKFYFSVNEPLKRKEDFDKVIQQLEQKVKSIVEEMKLK